MAKTKDIEHKGDKYGAIYSINEDGTTSRVRIKKNGRITSSSSVPTEVSSFLYKEIDRSVSQVEPSLDAVYTDEASDLNVDDYANVSVFKNETTLDSKDGDSDIFFGRNESDGNDNEKINKLKAEIEQLKMEQFQVEETSSVEIAVKLYETSKIYTPLLNRPPKVTDKSPLTGEEFTKFTFGQSLQAWKQFDVKGKIKEFQEVKTIIANSSYLDDDIEDEVEKAFAEKKPETKASQVTSTSSRRGFLTEDELWELEDRARMNSRLAVKTMGKDTTNLEDYGGSSEEARPRPPINGNGIPSRIFIDNNWSKTATISSDGKTRL